MRREDALIAFLLVPVADAIHDALRRVEVSDVTLGEVVDLGGEEAEADVGDERLVASDHPAHRLEGDVDKLEVLGRHLLTDALCAEVDRAEEIASRVGETEDVRALSLGVGHVSVLVLHEVRLDLLHEPQLVPGIAVATEELEGGRGEVVGRFRRGLHGVVGHHVAQGDGAEVLLHVGREPASWIREDPMRRVHAHVEVDGLRNRGKPIVF